MIRWKVTLWECERGWGQKIDEIKVFDTYEDAAEFVVNFNIKNNEKDVPDWYMYAGEPYRARD